jgi:outer membrane protein OmpA-like peptidoglycan-associated protein
MPLITDSMETSKAMAFDDEINSFETMESFALADESRFSELDNDPALTDSNSLAFSWQAAQETQGLFQPVYFGYDNSRIAHGEQPKVVKNAQHAKALVEEGKTVICKGKACKWGGTEVYNLALSDQRAQSVARELKAAGVPEESIKSFGVGTKESLAMGANKEAHASDRCVEMYTLTV